MKLKNSFAKISNSIITGIKMAAIEVPSTIFTRKPNILSNTVPTWSPISVSCKCTNLQLIYLCARYQFQDFSPKKLSLFVSTRCCGWKFKREDLTRPLRKLLWLQLIRIASITVSKTWMSYSQIFHNNKPNSCALLLVDGVGRPS